jgi:hypothetical protein
LEKVPLFSERNRQTTIKFDISPEVLFIYLLILEKLGFLEQSVFFDTTPIGRFLEVSFGVHCGIQHKSIVPGYQSIDMRCIVVPVKLDGGLSM